MPLFLFKQHWSIAKRKIRPVFGYMCTLDILGYSPEQFFTLPFLVLLKAMIKYQEDPKEVNKRILEQVEKTCIMIIEQHKEFRENLIAKFISFASKQDTSSRTSDVIKNINVFAAQIYCLLKLENLAEKVVSEEQSKQLAPANLKKLKNVFIRFATEEILRRGANVGEELVSEENLAKIMFPSHGRALEEIFVRREKELNELHTVKADMID